MHVDVQNLFGERLQVADGDGGQVFLFTQIWLQSLFRIWDDFGTSCPPSSFYPLVWVNIKINLATALVARSLPPAAPSRQWGEAGQGGAAG
jgi:hypothetical protein